MSGRVAVCGEALVDLVPAGDGHWAATPGGSPANVAVALARQGVPTAMLARLAADGFGDLVRSHLAANGVDLGASVVAAEPSSVALATPAADGSATYRFLLDGTADRSWRAGELVLPDGCVAFHTGSLALALDPGSLVLQAFLPVVREACTVSLDPNVRPDVVDLDAYRGVVETAVRSADLVKASAEDVALLHPGVAHHDVAARWLASGAGVVVVTDGPRGATGWTASGPVAVPAVPTAVVDTIGAGDTYAAGLLAWLHDAGRLGGRLEVTADDLRAAMAWAARSAAVTCSRRGADPPRRTDL